MTAPFVININAYQQIDAQKEVSITDVRLVHVKASTNGKAGNIC